MTLSIPRPALVLMMGVAGSGKSTFARDRFRPTEVVSSDACRALVADDEKDQTATKAAFEVLHLIVAQRLAAGKLTVVDATNVQAWARTSLLKLAREANVPAVAIVLNLPESVAAAQNASRLDRVVDSEAIRQQNLDLQASLLELPGEGFAAVYILASRDDLTHTSLDIS
ncbi:MAG: AAA family ATPase [Acidobacteriota bacterium]